MKKVIREMNLEDKLVDTRPPKEKKFTRVIDNIPLKEDYNFMIDLLHLPTTKKGNKYLLVLVDLVTNEFDIEPLKNKHINLIISSMEKMFKRQYLNKPFATIKGDNEFDKATFKKYLHDNNIIFRTTMPYRHKQMSSVESLNKQLAYIFAAYMNKKERETQKVYREWDTIINDVRKILNKHRKRKIEDIKVNEDYNFLQIQNKFNIGENVHFKLSYPENAFGLKQNTSQFRVGDNKYSKNAKKIRKILYYNGKVPYRYLLEGIPNVSFTEQELIK